LIWAFNLLQWDAYGNSIAGLIDAAAEAADTVSVLHNKGAAAAVQNARRKPVRETCYASLVRQLANGIAHQQPQHGGAAADLSSAFDRPLASGTCSYQHQVDTPVLSQFALQLLCLSAAQALLRIRPANYSQVVQAIQRGYNMQVLGHCCCSKVLSAAALQPLVHYRNQQAVHGSAAAAAAAAVLHHASSCISCLACRLHCRSKVLYQANQGLMPLCYMLHVIMG
jgi:Pyruvate/2-oxoacid:ferredoxin oxidoreductase delta subunit